MRFLRCKCEYKFSACNKSDYNVKIGTEIIRQFHINLSNPRSKRRRGISRLEHGVTLITFTINIFQAYC